MHEVRAAKRGGHANPEILMSKIGVRVSLDFMQTRNKSISDKTEHYSQNIKHDRITRNVNRDESRQTEKQMCSESEFSKRWPFYE